MSGGHETSSDKPLAPGLYLVATPIGNLEDITLRALRVLRSVDRIACEDTRQTQKLLNHFGIRTPTVSYHMHNEGPRTEELIGRVASGRPHRRRQRRRHARHRRPRQARSPRGHRRRHPRLPHPRRQRRHQRLDRQRPPDRALHLPRLSSRQSGPAKDGPGRALATRGDVTHIFYEAPHRILDTLADIAAIFGPGQHVVLARELTKLHEEFLRGPVAEVRAQLAARASVRGEMVLLLAPSPARDRLGAETAQPRRRSRGLMKSEGLSEKDALKRVARERGIGKSEAYRELQREQNRLR